MTQREAAFVEWFGAYGFDSSLRYAFEAGWNAAQAQALHNKPVTDAEFEKKIKALAAKAPKDQRVYPQAAVEPAQHFPFVPWSKEAEMMESWAQHKAVEWKTYIMAGRVNFCIGNQSFRIDFNPEEEDGMTKHDHLEWMRSMLAHALARLVTSPPDTEALRKLANGYLEQMQSDRKQHLDYRDKTNKAMRLALEALQSANIDNFEPYANWTTRRDAAIAALEKELK